jgi:hypothetical protein
MIADAGAVIASQRSEELKKVYFFPRLNATDVCLFVACRFNGQLELRRIGSERRALAWHHNFILSFENIGCV